MKLYEITRPVTLEKIEKRKKSTSLNLFSTAKISKRSLQDV